jgi:adenylosuccinate synthase
MTTAVAVIGANFGDEGKGLATDYFARRHTLLGRPPLVARCNGGAQAGHTVQDGDRRHVFGQVSAGTFAGSDTYLGSNFIINPIVLINELQALSPLKANPLVYANRDCRITTIFDMAINSLIELKRGKHAHGSCGMGINETVARHQAGFFLTLDAIKTFYPE